MYDYVDGKVDWMAYGLPVEGDDGPFLGGQVTAVPTCDVNGTVGDARQVLADSGADTIVLLGPDDLAVGEVDDDALAGQADGVALLDVLRPVPGTVRPSVTVASVARSGGGTQLVTTSDGRLLGAATVAAADDEHDGHDHDGHDHDHDGHDHDRDLGIDPERYEEELASVLQALEERFAGQEPSEDDVRAFLRERLVSEGRSEEEADRFLAELGPAEG